MIDLPATITALGALVAAVGVVLGAWWAYRAKAEATAANARNAETKIEIVRIGDNVYELGKKVDGRLTDLLEAMAEKGITDVALARSEGHAQGEQAQRDRAAPPEPNGGKR